MSESFDAIVFGHGISGFAAASTLAKNGKKVAVLYQSTGATSVSSGAWDFGVISKMGTSFEDAANSEPWKKHYANVLSGGKNLLNPQLMKESATQCAADLAGLAMTFAFDSCLTLPTTAGHWKNTFATQSPHAKGHTKNLSGKRVGLVGSKAWRFNADAIAVRLSQNAPKESNIKITAANINLDFIDNDCAMPHFASRLRTPEFFQKFVAAVKSLHGKFDLLLLPPVFLSCGLFAEFEKAVGIPLAECLAVTDPTPGYRLLQAITVGLKTLSVPTYRVQQVEPLIVDNKILGLKVYNATTKNWREVKASHYILSTGKLFGGGIHLGYRRVRETVFNLPVFRAKDDKPIQYRNELVWQDRNFYESQPWTELGLKVGGDWKILDESSTPVYENVRACGSVLGGVDFSKHRMGLGFMAHTGRECARGL